MPEYYPFLGVRAAIGDSESLTFTETAPAITKALTQIAAALGGGEHFPLS
jgi:hypothetical protein